MKRKSKTQAVDCVACGQPIRVPTGLSTATRLSCPLCCVNFRLADVLNQHLPLAKVAEIDEDDDSAVLGPIEELVKRPPRTRRELENPKVDRWKLATSTHSQQVGGGTSSSEPGHADGSLLAAGSDQVFARNFPYSKADKEKDRKAERELLLKKERRNRKKPVDQPITPPYGRLQVSSEIESDALASPTECSQEQLLHELPPLHSVLPPKRRHAVDADSNLHTAADPQQQMVLETRRCQEMDNQFQTSRNLAPTSSDDSLKSLATPRTSESTDSKNAPWVDMAIMIGCIVVTLPLGQLGLWWVVGIDPLGLAPVIRQIAPFFVPGQSVFG